MDVTTDGAWTTAVSYFLLNIPLGNPAGWGENWRTGPWEITEGTTSNFEWGREYTLLIGVFKGALWTEWELDFGEKVRLTRFWLGLDIKDDPGDGSKGTPSLLVIILK